MRRFFRGKLGALGMFLLVATLVAGGLGWVTADALRLELEQQQARADAEITQKLHVALWRLDGRVAPALAVEDSRPYSHYSAVFVPTVALRRRQRLAARQRHRAVAAASGRPARMDAPALPGRRGIGLGIAAGALRRPAPPPDQRPLSRAAVQRGYRRTAAAAGRSRKSDSCRHPAGHDQGTRRGSDGQRHHAGPGGQRLG